MSNDYNDGQVPGNSFAADINRGGTGSPTVIIAGAIFETFTPNRPGKKSNRPNQFSGPNGFLVTAEQESASGVFQIPTTGSATPKIGDWFQVTLDRGTGGLAGALETWTITDMSDPQNMGEYAKCNASFQRAHNPPV